MLSTHPNCQSWRCAASVPSDRPPQHLALDPHHVPRHGLGQQRPRELVPGLRRERLQHEELTEIRAIHLRAKKAALSVDVKLEEDGDKDGESNVALQSPNLYLLRANLYRHDRRASLRPFVRSLSARVEDTSTHLWTLVKESAPRVDPFPEWRTPHPGSPAARCSLCRRQS